MRWYGQLVVIGVLGGIGYAGYLFTRGELPPQVMAYGRQIPWLGQYAPPLPQATAPGAPGAPSGAPRSPGAGGPPGPGGPGGLPPPLVEVARVATARMTETTEAVGTARAFESIVVSARVAGIVGALNFEEGQAVKQGDVLVTLDASEQRADMDSARAAIEQTTAEIGRASAVRDEIRTRLERAQALRRTGTGTEASVDDLTGQMRTAEAAIRAAEAARRAAEARYKGAEARLGDYSVRAPFAGRVGVRQVSLGAYLAAGGRITTLDDISRVRVDFAVPENLLARLTIGQAVRARAAAFGARDFPGKLAVVDTRVDTATRTARLTAIVDNPQEALRPGMFLNITLEVAVRDDAVVVPEEAVVGEGLRHFVFVIADNRAERRLIRLGQRDVGRVEVVEGLKAGETIVVRGLQRVRPGQPVTPRPLGAAPPAGGPPGTAPPAGGPPAGGPPGAPRAPQAEGPRPVVGAAPATAPDTAPAPAPAPAPAAAPAVATPPVSATPPAPRG